MPTHTSKTVYEETGAGLDLSPGTIHREVKLAKAWLHRELTTGPLAETEGTSA